jgi:intracellular sulfur oxidation DsrE/DsrF family protein
METDMPIASHRRTAARAMGALLAGLLATTAFAQEPAKDSSSTRTAANKPPAKTTPGKGRKLAIQVDENKPEIMNLALNNAKNVVDYYKSKGETVSIEIVTFGPGLHMLRDDTSPVKQRIAQMALEEPSIVFIACANTQANQSKAENKQITLISEAKVMPSGVVRLMELQSKGYAYIRP